MCPPPSTTSLVSSSGAHHGPHSFPTRRSSDLASHGGPTGRAAWRARAAPCTARGTEEGPCASRSTPYRWSLDRKSTRLNSSHVRISYAVFCLKKKNHIHDTHSHPATPPHHRYY